jgi:hypothetical protein
MRVLLSQVAARSVTEKLGIRYVRELRPVTCRRRTTRRCRCRAGHCHRT